MPFDGTDYNGHWQGEPKRPWFVLPEPWETLLLILVPVAPLWGAWLGIKLCLLLGWK